MRFAAPRTHPCSHYNAICIHSLQNTEEEPIDLATIQTAPATHRRYPSSPAAVTLHGKTLGFVLRLPHQSIPKPAPCNNLSLSVLLCDVKSHTTRHWVYCYVMSSLTPPFIECIVMWCQVSHHPSLSVLLRDVKSNTTLHWVYCYVM